MIKDPINGDVVTFEKSTASPAPPSKSPAVAPTPTPPPRAPSHTDTQQPRIENKSVKTDDEKRKEMRETIAKKMEADRAEEQRKKDEEESKAAQQKKDSEDKLFKEKEEADARQREAATAQREAEEALKKDKAAAEEAESAAAKARAEADEAAEKARKEQEQEDEYARMEAEFAEMERKEKEAEERYAAKKKAEKEEAARKEAEAFKMADEEMKRAEREAEEAEEARLKETEKSKGDDSQKERVDMFAQLKKDGSATPTSDAPATAEGIPVDSGVATPASDAPAPAAPPKPAATGGKQKPTALKLDTAKPVEPAQPSAQLLSLRSARRLMSINDVSYPAPINSPNPALNTGAPTGKLRYNKEFLLQFQRAFVEKPSENWTERVKETVGDTSEPSSARTPARGGGGAGSVMTGRQPSNRAPLAQMGAFAQGGRTLPPNTTSTQRFEAATANRNAQPARPTMQNPLASFVGRGPGSGFPTPATSTKMDRTPSSTSLNHPNSPRNASQRGGSQRGSRAATRREDPKDNKAMPLTAGANLKPIEITASGWKPRSVGGNATGMVGPAPGGDGHLAPDVVQRKVKSNLNKMTPNNFDKITVQILDISSQSKDEADGRTLRQVIQLTFEKATDEAHWAEMYAQFCKRMLESMSPEIKDENILDKKGEVVHGGALFRKYLLNRCQEEFERGWKLDLGDKPEGETEEAKMLSDEYYKEAAAKRRGLGLVRFIGELYKLGMLTERIMHECVKKLVDYEGMPDEAEVESLTNLLRTIGQPLDSTNNGPKMMDVYFMKINEMIVIEGLPSRLRFMLMDIVDLRKKNWHSKGGALKGPTTLEEVRTQVSLLAIIYDLTNTLLGCSSRTREGVATPARQFPKGRRWRWAPTRRPRRRPELLRWRSVWHDATPRLPQEHRWHGRSSETGQQRRFSTSQLSRSTYLWSYFHVRWAKRIEHSEARNGWCSERRLWCIKSNRYSASSEGEEGEGREGSREICKYIQVSRGGYTSVHCIGSDLIAVLSQDWSLQRPPTQLLPRPPRHQQPVPNQLSVNEQSHPRAKNRQRVARMPKHHEKPPASQIPTITPTTA